MMDLEAVQSRLGIRFANVEMLQQALTHRSYGNDLGEPIADYERLEFLGDAVLDFLSADFVFAHFPDVAEGELTRLRVALVRTEALAQLAQLFGLGEHIRMSKGEEAGEGRQRAGLLCDVFEAVIAVIYLEKGVEAVREFITPLLMARKNAILDEATHKDPRSHFQEWAQAVYLVTPHFEVLQVGGVAHQPEYMVGLYLGEHLLTKGIGQSKRAAAQNAAQNALLMRDMNHPILVAIPKPLAGGQKPDAVD